MKAGRLNFRKALIWIGGVILVGLVALIFAPGNIEGVYSDRESQCMCGHRFFIRFHEGNVLLYNTGHPPANWVGTYHENDDRTVSSELFGGGSMLSEPGLLFLRRLESTDHKSGWDFRAVLTAEVRDAIQHRNIEKVVVSKIGLEQIEVYDSDLQLIERKWY